MDTFVKTLAVGDIEICCEEQGDGEPVLLIHGGLFATGMAPLLQEPALAGHRLVRYHRRGLGGTTRGTAEPTVTTQVGDALGVLDALDVDAAHVVTHSASGPIGLELASAHTDRVRSLVLMEPGLPEPLSHPEMLGKMMPIIARLADDAEAAVRDAFVLLLGAGFEDVLALTAPDAMAQGMAEADVWASVEVPMTLGWSFGAADAAAIRQPVLFVIGSESDATLRQGGVAFDVFEAIGETLAGWFPQLETARVEGVNHLLQLQDPSAVAAAVAPFLARG
jgi:3-oxoadipate enol-lactonase